MAYTNAIFYVDPSLAYSADNARADLVPSAYANNGAGLVRVTVGGLGAIPIVTDAVVTIAGTTGSVYVGAWKVTVIDSTHIDLQGSTYTSNPATKGTCIPRGGDSWANAWKTLTTGASAARLAAGDTVRIAKSPAPVQVDAGARWVGVGTMPAAVGITSSTNATPIQITKNGHGLSNNDIVRITGHTTNTAANGVWKIQNVAANTFELVGSVGNGIGGASGTYQLINKKCVLLSATTATKTVDNCDANWTLANSATQALGTTGHKEGTGKLTFTMPASPATNTLYAYKAIGGGAGVDFSAYQKLSFWMAQSVALTTDKWKLCLCSNADGTGIVDEFLLYEERFVVGTTLIAKCVARTGGGNLGNSIQSIALYSSSVAPANGNTIAFDNIIATKTNNIHLAGYISKNANEQGGTEPWIGIQSIKDDIVVLEGSGAGTPADGWGYVGANETVATYFRTAFVTKCTNTTSECTDTTPNCAGTSDSVRVSYLGGYNTSNNAQDGETFWEGTNSSGYGFNCNALAYITCDRLNFVRFYYGISYGSGNYVNVPHLLTVGHIVSSGGWAYGGNYGIFGDMGWVFGGATTPINLTGTTGYNTIDKIQGVIGGGAGGNGWFLINSPYTKINTIGPCKHSGGGGLQIQAAGIGSEIGTIGDIQDIYNDMLLIQGVGIKIGTVNSIDYNTGGGSALSMDSGARFCRISKINSITRGAISIVGNDNTVGFGTVQTGQTTQINLNPGYNTKIIGGTASGSTNSFSCSTSVCTRAVVENFATSDTNPVSAMTTRMGSYVYFQNFNNVAGVHKIVTDSGVIDSEAGANRHTLAGIAWALNPSAASRGQHSPLQLNIGKIYVNAGTLVTFSVWVKKSHATNVGARIALLAPQLGLTTTVATTKANDTNYEQLTITFTPVYAGMAEIIIEAWYIGASAYVYVDDVTVVQA